jgi:hypothetical protein
MKRLTFLVAPLSPVADAAVGISWREMTISRFSF